MSQSTGQPQSRENFEGVNAVVLPNEILKSMVLTFFVDLKNEIIFVILEGGMESAFFHFREELTYIENIDMVGVDLETYVDGINEVSELAQDRYTVSPIPPYEEARERLLTRAQVKRSASTN